METVLFTLTEHGFLMTIRIACVSKVITTCINVCLLQSSNAIYHVPPYFTHDCMLMVIIVSFEVESLSESVDMFEKVHWYKYDNLSFGIKLFLNVIVFSIKVKSGHWLHVVVQQPILRMLLFPCGDGAFINICWPFIATRRSLFSINSLDVFTIHSRLYLRTENLLFYIFNLDIIVHWKSVIRSTNFPLNG